ncbi:MAG: winged helix-turn-helix domain-containing protein [Chthoniobacterales bacterium]
MKALVYEFGEFRLDPAHPQLSRRDGTPIALTQRVFDTLLFMVEHQGTVLDKERLMEAVWPDSIVEENNLSQNISKLRPVFGEKPGTHRFIVTVPGRGYRFAAEVKTAEQAGKISQASSLHEESQQAGSLRDHEPIAEKHILWLVSFTALAILRLEQELFSGGAVLRTIPLPPRPIFHQPKKASPCCRLKI